MTSFLYPMQNSSRGIPPHKINKASFLEIPEGIKLFWKVQGELLGRVILMNNIEFL